MTLLPSQAEIAFERYKDDGRVQAILKSLGKMREHVVDWSITTRPGVGPTYKVTLEDGQEIRGIVAWNWRHNEWIASGTLVPKEVAQMERSQAQKPQE